MLIQPVGPVVITIAPPLVLQTVAVIVFQSALMSVITSWASGIEAPIVSKPNGENMNLSVRPLYFLRFEASAAPGAMAELFRVFSENVFVQVESQHRALS